MKKVLALFSIVALTACGGQGSSTEVKTDSSAVVVDSLKVDSAAVTVDTTATVEEVK